MSEANRLLQERLDSLLAGRAQLAVLEAGCGSTSHIRIPHASRYTGIDISARQLARNSRLDEKILGDLQSYPLPEQRFDVVVSWDVLEHLPDPQAALHNLCRATAAGGLLVLAAPNFLSVKGLVTKLLPHPLHVAFYRYVIGDSRAGKDDQGPFKTYLRRSMWPDQVSALAARLGLDVVFLHKYEGPVPSHLRRRHRSVDLLFGGVDRLSCKLLGPARNLTHSDYLMILRKGGAV